MRTLTLLALAASLLFFCATGEAFQMTGAGYSLTAAGTTNGGGASATSSYQLRGEALDEPGETSLGSLFTLIAAWPMTTSAPLAGTPPVLAITNPGQDITTTLASYLLRGTVSDNFAVTTISVAVDGVALAPAPTVGADGSFQQVIGFSALKSYAVSVTATDQAGNSTTVQRNFVYGPAAMAAIDLGSASGARGKTVTLPISLINVAGVQLATVGIDLGYDPTLLLNPTVALGPAGTAAGKLLLSSAPANGVFRIGLYDTGNAVLGNGILANVTFSIAPAAGIGTVSAVSNTPKASDAAANDLAISGAGATVSVTALPGDCNADNGVSPGEFTSAINRFMGRGAGTSCVSFYGGVTVTPGYFTKVINAFMER